MMTAYQRLIREQEAARNPRAVIPLSGATVERVPREWAEDIIHRYEWLGTLGNFIAGYGLKAEDGTPLGVACFGMPGGTSSRDVCGPEWRDRTICLNRGACVHFAHEHAASFLIPKAVKMAAADFGWRVFFAYSDEQAGEIGTVYQATNWLYIGKGNGRGNSPGRWKARRRLETGEWGPWMSSRVLRRSGLLHGKEEWQAARSDPDWQLELDKAKGRYVTFAGSRRERREARSSLRYEPQPYTKRTPLYQGRRYPEIPETAVHHSNGYLYLDFCREMEDCLPDSHPHKGLFRIAACPGQDNADAARQYRLRKKLWGVHQSETERTCQECGEIIDPLRPAKTTFCSNACRQKAYRRRHVSAEDKERLETV